MLPKFSESDVRQRANEKSWARGKNYVDGVDEVVWRDGVLMGEVPGSDDEPYRIQVRFAGDQIVSADCSCPYNFDGDCKHIVAVLLNALENADKIEELPSLDKMLSNLKREQLIALLTDLAFSRPVIIGDIQRFVLTENTTVDATPDRPAIPNIDTTLLRRQIISEIKGSVKHGYDGWGEEAFYDSDFSPALQPAIQQAYAYIEAGNPRAAFVILEVATKAWDDGIDSLDEYVYEAFEDMASEFTIELGEVWAEAILSADLTPAERESWHEKLFNYSEEIFGGYSLEVAAIAAEHGWDYAPLVAVLEGNITDNGAWEGDAPDGADDLALIRLRILDRQGRLQEYLNLAQAEGRFMLYLAKLVKLGQIEKAMEEALDVLRDVGEIEQFGRTLADNGEVEKAIAIGKHGLTLASTDSPKQASFAAWLRDLAHQTGDRDLALKAAQEAYASSVTLKNYLAVEEQAGDDWEEIRPILLEQAAKLSEASNVVDIYLHEKMYKEAINCVNSASWFHNIERVIEAVKADYPDWAFQQCRKRADEIMDAGRSGDYRTAADWLRQGRDILTAAGKRGEWFSYFNEVKQKHARKYTLMPLLKML